MPTQEYTLHDLRMASLVDGPITAYIEGLDNDEAVGSPGRLADDISIMDALQLVRRRATLHKMDGKQNEALTNLMMLLVQGQGFLENIKTGPMQENLVKSRYGRTFCYVPTSLTPAELGAWLSDPDLYYEYQNVQYDVSALLE